MFLDGNIFSDTRSRAMKRIDFVDPDSQIYGNISGLRKKLKNIESVGGHSIQALQLRNEITRLEALLPYSSVRKNPSYVSFFQEKLRR